MIENFASLHFQKWIVGDALTFQGTIMLGYATIMLRSPEHNLVFRELSCGVSSTSLQCGAGHRQCSDIKETKGASDGKDDPRTRGSVE